MEEAAKLINIFPNQDFDEKSGIQAFKRPRSSDEQQELEDAIQNKRAKFVSQIPAYIRILMASKDAGPVIGKGGSFIRSLRENYNANVLLPDCAGPERILIVSTTLANACSIIVDIMKAIEGMNKSGKDMSLKMLIHQSQAGAIIGKNGANIKDFREKCKAMIKVYPECAPASSERVVEIKGQPEIIAGTVYTLVEFLQSFLPIGTVYPYDPINYDESFSAEYGGYAMFDRNPPTGREGARGSFGFTRQPRGRPRGLRANFVGPFPLVPPEGANFGNDIPKRGAFRGPQNRGNRGGRGQFPVRSTVEELDGYKSFEEQAVLQPLIGDQTPISVAPPFVPLQVPFTGSEEIEMSQVTIPSELAGSIIGRGGVRIKQIRADSCASIDIDTPQPGSNERVITIRGTTAQIQHAQYLLQNSVKKYSGKY